MYLFFDTETTGLVKKTGSPGGAAENYPRLVQIGWSIYTDGGQHIACSSALIKPVGFTIPASATKVHGITTAQAAETGVDLSAAMEWFAEAASEATVLVAHNMDFDYGVVKAEFMRTGIPDTMTGKKSICTMKTTAKFVGIPGYKGFKYPTLAELYYSLFKRDMPLQAHSALPDAEICAMCFWELKKQGVL